jgi:hypothetical protein
LLVGILLWQMDQLGYGMDMLMTDMLDGRELEVWQPPATVTAAEWTPLAELWEGYPEEVDETEIIYSFRYSLLVTQYMVEVYGVERLPPMVNTLRTADSLEGWVAAVTGQPLDEFEVAWREWVIADRADR